MAKIIEEVRAGKTTLKQIISNDTYMFLARNIEGKQPLRNTRSFHAKCPCCGTVEYEMHLYEE